MDWEKTLTLIFGGIAAIAGLFYIEEWYRKKYGEGKVNTVQPPLTVKTSFWLKIRKNLPALIVMCCVLYTIFGSLWMYGVIQKSEHAPNPLPLPNTNRDKILPSNFAGTNVLSGNTMELAQAFDLVKDQENASIANIDKIISDLVTYSLATYVDEKQPYEKSYPVQEIHGIDQKIFDMTSNQKGFMINLERLRSFSTRRIVAYYQDQFLKSYPSSPNTFSSSIREKPKILSELFSLANKLETNKTATDWNLNATKAVNEFINTH
jgi:hypothetical protein